MKEVDVITQVFSTIKILEKRGYSVNRKNNYAKSPLDKLNIKVRVSVSNLTRKSSFEWL
jgi:predicted HTH transcriptional regulator